jgi:hypothetical protein
LYWCGQSLLGVRPVGDGLGAVNVIRVSLRQLLQGHSKNGLGAVIGANVIKAIRVTILLVIRVIRVITVGACSSVPAPTPSRDSSKRRRHERSTTCSGLRGRVGGEIRVGSD